MMKSCMNRADHPHVFKDNVLDLISRGSTQQDVDVLVELMVHANIDLREDIDRFSDIVSKASASSSLSSMHISACAAKEAPKDDVTQVSALRLCIDKIVTSGKPTAIRNVSLVLQTDEDVSDEEKNRHATFFLDLCRMVITNFPSMQELSLRGPLSMEILNLLECHRICHTLAITPTLVSNDLLNHRAQCASPSKHSSCQQVDSPRSRISSLSLDLSDLQHHLEISSLRTTQMRILEEVLERCINIKSLRIVNIDMDAVATTLQLHASSRGGDVVLGRYVKTLTIETSCTATDGTAARLVGCLPRLTDLYANSLKLGRMVIRALKELNVQRISCLELDVTASELSIGEHLKMLETSCTAKQVMELMLCSGVETFRGRVICDSDEQISALAKLQTFYDDILNEQKDLHCGMISPEHTIFFFGDTREYCNAHRHIAKTFESLYNDGVSFRMLEIALFCMGAFPDHLQAEAIDYLFPSLKCLSLMDDDITDDALASLCLVANRLTTLRLSSKKITLEGVLFLVCTALHAGGGRADGEKFHLFWECSDSDIQQLEHVLLKSLSVKSQVVVHKWI